MKLKKDLDVPYFSVIDHNGETHKSTDYLGKKLIIFFYPKANTPGCTAQACNLSENFSVLKSKGFNILGVSADSTIKQKKFAEKFNFPFPLIVDEKKELIKLFGVWGPKKFMGKEYEGILRTTFIINEKGKIDRIIEKVKTKDHTNQIV